MRSHREGNAVELRCDDVILVRWLTSNPQHFNPRNAIAIRCLPLSELATPWPVVLDGVNDPADISARAKIKYRIARPKGDWPELPPFIQQAIRKALPKPKPADDPTDLA